MSTPPAAFRFSTSILRRLGEELNPSLDQGIIELVKNAYDADALNCVVVLDDINEPGGTIRVSDDGNGMDELGIRDGWLVLGASSKSSAQKTTLGRIPAGSKGLGRLAALRMGNEVQLRSRPIKNPGFEYELNIDWSAYDGARLVDDVELNIVRDSTKSTPGSNIVIRGLRNAVNRVEVKKLARALLLLADPFTENSAGFKPMLKAPEYADLERLVKLKYFTEAEYRLVANLNQNGEATATITDWKGNLLFSAQHTEISGEKGSPKYNCPPADFEFWVFILDAAIFSATRSSPMASVREWLETFGGVHLYQNGLRVSPYGNPGNDWLDINLRRSQNPEERPSTNTSIGKLSIVDTSSQLQQKTDRSGFIEDSNFLEIKRFATDVLEWMAGVRLEMAEQRRAKKRAETPQKSDKAKQSLESAINKGSRKKIAKAFTKYETAKRREVDALRREIQLYRTLSTAGIVAATFAHESTGNPIKSITFSIKEIARRAKKALGPKYDTSLKEQVDHIIRATDSLSVLGHVTLSLVDHEKRRSERVDIHHELSEIKKAFSPFLDERTIKVNLDLDKGSPYLKGSKAAFESIVTNLLSNSISWFAGIQRKDRTVIVRTRLVDGMLEVRFMDNGPGIRDISVRRIWLPGQTTRPNGTGLGLTIVRDAVKDLGGSVTALEKGELGGAEIIIKLPVLGA